MTKELMKQEKQMVAFDYGKKIAEFKAKNAEFELDFVDLGSKLKINSKGQFHPSDNEDHVMNEIEVVLLQGRPQYNLWGKDGTPQESTLLISADSMDDAIAQFEELCAAEDGEVFAQLYTEKDIADRYIITMLDRNENIYILDMSKSSKKEFGKYAASLNNIHQVGIQDVVTKISTAAKKGNGFQWNVVTFEMAELLNKVEDTAAEDVVEAELVSE